MPLRVAPQLLLSCGRLHTSKYRMPGKLGQALADNSYGSRSLLKAKSDKHCSCREGSSV